MKRIAAFAFLALLAGAQAAHAEDPEHIVISKTSQTGAVTLEAFAARIETDAAAFRKQYPQGASRNVEFDGAYPATHDEYAAFGRQSVVLIGAITHDAGELPVTRVYVRSNGKDFDLHRVASVRRDVPPGSVTAEIFGTYREDSFYLVPLAIQTPGATLMCDFAANRTGFVISNDFVRTPDFIRDDADRATGADPSPEAMKAFLDREYPGFVP